MYIQIVKIQVHYMITIIIITKNLYVKFKNILMKWGKYRLINIKLRVIK